MVAPKACSGCFGPSDYHNSRNQDIGGPLTTFHHKMVETEFLRVVSGLLNYTILTKVPKIYLAVRRISCAATLSEMTKVY